MQDDAAHESRRAAFVFQHEPGDGALSHIANELSLAGVSVTRHSMPRDAVGALVLGRELLRQRPGLVVTEARTARLLGRVTTLLGASLVIYQEAGSDKTLAWSAFPAHVISIDPLLKRESRGRSGEGVAGELVHLFSLGEEAAQADLLLELLERRPPNLGKRVLRGAVARVFASTPRRLLPERPIALAYHRVCRELRGWDPNMVISASTFARQVQALKRLGRVAHTQAELATWAELPDSPPSFAISFDDGYADVLEVAAPILHDLSVPFTVYVITDVLAGRIRAPWYDVVAQAILSRQVRRKTFPILLDEAVLQPLLTGPGALPASPGLAMGIIGAMKGWPGARRLSLARRLAEAAGEEIYAETPRYLDRTGATLLHQAGAEISSHTATHPILPRLPQADVEEELVRSRSFLLELFGACEGIAYPNGDSDDRVRAAAASAGYRYGVAVTLQKGPASRFNLGRRMMSEGSSASVSHQFDESVFLARVLGAFG